MGNLTHTVSGNIASFRSAARVPIESLKCYFLPVQEGSGDPSPENIRPIVGWNNFNIIQCSTNLFNKDEDYSANNFYYKSDGTMITDNNYRTTGYIKIKPLTTYFWAINGVDGITRPGHSAPRVAFFDINKSWISSSESLKQGRNMVSPANAFYARLPVYVHDSSSVSSAMFVESETQPTVYEPYREQTIPVTFPVVGKNKFNINTLVADGITVIDGIASGTGSDFNKNFCQGHTKSINFITPKDTQITVSFKACTDGNKSTEHTTGLVVYIDYTDGTKTGYYSVANDATTYTQYSVTSTAGKDVKQICFSYSTHGENIWHMKDLQIELGNTATTYESYSSDNTLLGGYIDIATGQLYQGWRKIKVTDLNWSNYSGKKSYYANVTTGLTGSYRQQNTYIYSDTVPMRTTGGHLNANVGQITYYGESTTTSANINNVWIMLPEAMEQDEAKAWIAEQYPNAYLYYQLATPILIGIMSPTQINTLAGHNNIWSNTNSITSVDFKLHESKEIAECRKKIIMNQPHIATSSGNIATFNTDMIAPIESAKFYFNCRKENGTPSLTSPKQVLSRTNMEVYSYGENLFNINTDVVGSKYVDYTTGNLTTWGSSWNASTFIAIEPNTVYTLRCSNSGLSVAGFAFYDSTQTYISGIRNNHSSSVPTATTTFTTPSNAAYIRFTFVEPLNYLTVLVKGESIPNLNTYSIDWSEIGELYGGYVDLVNGNLYKTYNRRNLKDYRFGYYTTYQYYLTCSDRKKTSTNLYANIFPISTTNDYPQVNYSLGYYSNGASYANIIFIRYEDAGEGAHSTEFNTWLQNLENDPYIVYEMEEPEYIATLTPYSLKSLRGKNIIQGNGRGPGEITYWTH